MKGWWEGEAAGMAGEGATAKDSHITGTPPWAPASALTPRIYREAPLGVYVGTRAGQPPPLPGVAGPTRCPG